jgi:hypothetical protein
VRAPGVAIDVGLQAARPALASGFSDHVGDEPWAWIVGRHAELAVPWPAELARDEGLDVLVSLAPFAGLASPGTLAVQVGSTGTPFALAPGPQTVVARVPPDALAAGDEVRVVLAPSDAISPQALGQGDDPRELAAAVHRVEVRPVRSWCGRW